MTPEHAGVSSEGGNEKGKASLYCAGVNRFELTRSLSKVAKSSLCATMRRRTQTEDIRKAREYWADYLGG